MVTTTPQLMQVKNAVAGKLHISQRNVPYIVFTRNSITYSVCWFSCTQAYRLFWPYPSNMQYKRTFNTLDELLTYLQELL